MKKIYFIPLYFKKILLSLYR